MGELKLIVKPDEEEGEGAELFVDGLIGGNAFRFLLDTGASRTCILRDDYTAAFPITDQSHSSGVFATHSEDLIIVPSIEVGSISRQNFTVARSEANPHVRNLIGMDLLKDFCCHFRFDENRVILDPDTAALDLDLQPLLLDQKSHPYVDVHFGRQAAKAVWDTGASITIADMTFIQQHPEFFQPVGQSTGTDSTGTQVETPMFLTPETIIGSDTFAPVRVAGVDLSPVNAMLEVPMDMILGYTTLSQANWLFDFPRKQWAISKRLLTP